MEKITVVGIMFAIIVAAVVGIAVRWLLSLFNVTRPHADTAGAIAALLVLLTSLYNVNL